MDKLAQSIHDRALKLLAMIGHPDQKPEVSEMDPGLWLIDFHDLGLFIESGVECPSPSIVVKSVRPGFRVGYWKVYPGNRTTPPETEDVEEYKGSNQFNALAALGKLVVESALTQIHDAESQEF